MVVQELPIAARLVALNLINAFVIESGDRKYIKQIKTVCLYDQNRATYCCELTPSYYLEPLYDEVVLTELGEELSESERDNLFERYENQGWPEPIYLHCRIVDKIITDENRFYDCGNTPLDPDETYEEQFDHLREYYSCNRML